MWNRVYQFPVEQDMDITIDNSQLTEWVTPDTIGPEYEAVDITAIQYWKVVTISDRVLYQESFDDVQSAVAQLAEKMYRIHDKVIQNWVNDWNNVIYWGNATSRATVDATDTIVWGNIAEAVARLRGNAAPTFNTWRYAVLLHPFLINDLFGETGTTFPSVQSLATWWSEQWFDTAEFQYINTYAWADVYSSSNIDAFVWAWASWINVYPTYVLWGDAYWVVNEWTLITSIIDWPSKSDPLSQRLIIWGKMAVNADILRQESMFRIETAASLDV